MKHSILFKLSILSLLTFGLFACGGGSDEAPASKPAQAEASKTPPTKSPASKPATTPAMKKAVDEAVTESAEAVEKVERDKQTFSADTDLVEAYKEILESQDLATFKKSSKLDGKITVHVDANQSVIDELSAISDKDERSTRAIELFCESDIGALAKLQGVELRIKIWKPDGGFSPLTKADCSNG